MGILDVIVGNASEVDIQEIRNRLSHFVVSGETIAKAYKTVRDFYVFTNKRLILIDYQGMTGTKAEYRSIPYSKITQFSVETAGNFDHDAELKIWVSGLATPIEKSFNKKLNILDIERTLAEYVL